MEDNKDLNEFFIIYKVIIFDLYIVENKKCYLYFWNWNNFIDDGVEKYFYKDFLYWIDWNVIKIEFYLMIDKLID